ncbi:MAG: DUF1571 domain-containing protein [Planctomycetota bacterium]
MADFQVTRRLFLGAMFSAGSAIATLPLLGDEPAPRDQLKEPLLRVGNKNVVAEATAKAPAAEGHPLDPALEIARQSLDHIHHDIADYSCTLVKRERIKGKLGESEYMFAKIRNRRVENGEVKVPLAVYMYFLKPDNLKGREVIYVEGENGGKLAAHEGGAKGGLLPTVWVKPDSMLAMAGNRYPITEVGIENLVARLIEKGERDRQRDECTVEFRKNAKINKRPCTVLRVVHPVERDYFDFHIAEIFIDDEHQIPVRYAAYLWPAGPGGEPQVLEEYTYLNMKINVGLKAIDFDHTNPDYNFVRKKS